MLLGSYTVKEVKMLLGSYTVKEVIIIKNKKKFEHVLCGKGSRERSGHVGTERKPQYVNLSLCILYMQYGSTYQAGLAIFVIMLMLITCLRVLLNKRFVGQICGNCNNTSPAR